MAADVATNGVKSIETVGKADNWTAKPYAAWYQDTALRAALNRIAYLRPAGDVKTAGGTRKLVEQMETIALLALRAPPPPTGFAEGVEAAARVAEAEIERWGDHPYVRATAEAIARKVRALGSGE